MELKEFNNKVVRITDIDGQIFKGVALTKTKMSTMKNLMDYPLILEPDGLNSLKMKSRKLKLLIKSTSQKAPRLVSKG